jgi:hypothetical protein
MDRRNFLAASGAALACAGWVPPAQGQSKLVLKAADAHPLGYPTV